MNLKKALPLLLLLEVLLVAYGVTATPPAARRVEVLAGSAQRIVAVVPERQGDSPLVATFDARGWPHVEEKVDLPWGAGALLGDEPLVFGRGFVWRLRVRTGEDEGIEVARSEANPKSYAVDAAAGDGSRVLVLGRIETGEPEAQIYDGIEFKPLELGLALDGRPCLGLAAARLRTAGFRVAAWTAQELYVGDWRDVDAEPPVWAAPQPLTVAPRAAAFVTDVEGVPALAVEESGRDARLLRFELDAGGLRLAEARAPAPGRLLGGVDAGVVPDLPISGMLLLERDSQIEAVAGERDEVSPPPPLFVAPWYAQRLRFKQPLYLHLVLFMVVGLLLRRRFGPAAGPDAARRERAARPARVFALAPFGRRLLATLFDFGLALVLACALFSASMPAVLERWAAAELAALSEVQIGSTNAPVSATLWLLAFDMTLLFVLLLTAIQGLTEAWFGRSLGKRIFGLRVVGFDGEPVSVPAALLRASMFFIYAIPYFGLMDAMAVLFTRRRQRLGDLFAGTVVVMERPVAQRPRGPLATQPSPIAGSGRPPGSPPVA